MPYDGSGNFNRVHDWTADEGAGIKVRADRFDAENDDFATAFENCITRDGQGKPTANIDFNNKKITNLADATLLQDAVNVRSSQRNTYSFGTTAGSANTYTLALGVTVASLVDGQPFRAEINVTNTSSSTLNVDSIGAKTIKADGQDLTGGELQANSIYCFAYNQGQDVIDLIKPANATETLKGIVELATSAETITGTDTTRATHPAGVTSAISSNLVLFGGKYGLKTENDSGDTDHDIKINTGVVIDSSQTVTINLQSAIIKRIDANWVEGTNQGGFPTGISLSPNTWYYVFVIAKTDGTVDAGYDTSLTATNLLSDASAYTYYKIIGFVLTDSSSNIYQFIQYGIGSMVKFVWKGTLVDYNGTLPSSGVRTSYTLSAPVGVRSVVEFCEHSVLSAANEAYGVSVFPTEKTTVPTYYQYWNTGGNMRNSFVANVMTNTSSQIDLQILSVIGGPGLPHSIETYGFEVDLTEV